MYSLFYISIFGLISIYLAVQVIKQRRKSQTAYGSGDAGSNGDLTRAVTAHGNFSTYIPVLAILLMGLDLQMKFNPELSNYHWLVHLFGILVLLGRIFHAYGLLVGEKGNKFMGRIYGMMMTFLSIALMSLANIIFSFISL